MEQQADEYETDIFRVLLALDKEDRATAQNKEQDALIARLAPPSSRLEVDNAKLKAEVAAVRAGAACPPPPTARSRRRAAALGSALCVGRPVHGAPATKRRRAAAHGSALCWQPI